MSAFPRLMQRNSETEVHVNLNEYIKGSINPVLCLAVRHNVIVTT